MNKQITKTAIEQNDVYKQILADSFGGVIYNVANREKYDTAELLALWNSLTAAEREAAGGIMRGAIAFVSEAA
ncbi:hypothetical protein G3I13_01845 [Streptomyces sp. SID6673]|nr:hypothetical protein [Streptomyces sp. SID11726]NDZ94903.1 hypothetical protein [Streptomyces sp. SID11726]NEB23063.1 hypothetical protein [Streptomyces sp. SID6673]